MTYQLIYSERFIKKIKKLPPDVQERIYSSLERIRIRPYSFVKKLVGMGHLFRFRVGDYRLIMDIKDNELQILVLKLGHRKNIYKK